MNAILNQFISRVQSAAKARSKDVRLSIDEGQAIVAEITKLLVRDNSMLDQINNLLNNSQTTRFSKTDNTAVEQPERLYLSGGKFTDD